MINLFWFIRVSKNCCAIFIIRIRHLKTFNSFCTTFIFIKLYRVYVLLYWYLVTKPVPCLDSPIGTSQFGLGQAKKHLAQPKDEREPQHFKAIKLHWKVKMN